MSMKRQLAERMGFDVIKVDGWFVRKRFALGIRRTLSKKSDLEIGESEYKTIVATPDGAFYAV